MEAFRKGKEEEREGNEMLLKVLAGPLLVIFKDIAEGHP